MLTPEQQEMLNFIAVGGKLPKQIRERYNSEYPPDLLALMDAGYIIRNEIVLEETGDATTVRRVPDVVITYGLTAAGLFALT